MTQHTINGDFCYNPNKEFSLSITQQALKRYLENKEEAFNISGTIPIIIDTSVLLTYYGMSQQDKKNLLTFFEEQKNRIILTRQVEKEFLRNRISVIQRNFFDPLNKIPQSFTKTYQEIRNKFNNFLNEHKKILSKDYPELWQQLSEKRESLEQILSDEAELGGQIKKRIEETTKDNQNININDELLNVCSEFTVLPPLNDEEIKFIEDLYNQLYKIYQNTPSNKRKEVVFPGCGDQDEKKEYPYGDFIIFHEILKFMKTGLEKEEQQGTDIIFLTYEKSKRDWFNEDMSPIVHYIEQVYFNTEKSLFIVDAERSLENISFDNVHQSETSNQDIIRESMIFSLNKVEKWGFIETRINNLYFNPQLMKNPDEFMDLNEGDVIRYQIIKNQFGEDIAGNVEKITYSFDDDKFSKEKSTIRSIRKFGDGFGFGFIDAKPENLYFKSIYVTGDYIFEDLKKLDQVEYIKGKNEEGEEIARLVRKVEEQN